jgi:hypothetical protein
MDLLDIAIIRDVRTGQYAKKPKVCDWHFYFQRNRYVCDMRLSPYIFIHVAFLIFLFHLGFKTKAHCNNGLSTGLPRRENSDRLLRFRFCECYIHKLLLCSQGHCTGECFKFNFVFLKIHTTLRKSFTSNYVGAASSFCIINVPWCPPTCVKHKTKVSTYVSIQLQLRRRKFYSFVLCSILRPHCCIIINN